ncbi:TorA chaperone [Mannheimia varigena USDA-ARS-USMARC-1388]|uniref:molecular chaperone TorD n=1 Tax=Mannheimia varigena TaxID=85404 RepID=UPI0003E339DD|nr:molecular chaperone TorD [Mannheimia varigena]AHG80461.1 TorA chaperone [Mannheimia varigena USDA-ARS-USMARC-1388]
MQQTDKLSREERRFIYGWFNAMLARELSDEQLSSLQAGKFDDFFAFLAELDFGLEIAKFQAELAASSQLEFPRLELAADFAQLFLLEGSLSAIPYASAYLQNEVLAQNLAEMDALLARFALQVNRESKEPSDHICVYLSVLDKLLEQGAEAEIKAFLEQQLNSWLPIWAEKAVEIKSQTLLYQSLVRLLEKFVRFDV